MANNRGKISIVIFALDVIGFILILSGAGLIRFSKDEVISILGGFVLAGGVALLSITRLIQK